MAFLIFYFPVKQKTVSMKQLKSPWLTDDLFTCIKKKHKFFSLYKQGEITREFYTRYKNLLTFAIRKSKEQYFHDSFTWARNDMGKMWKLINNFLSKNRTTVPEAIRLPDNTTISNPVDIASAINKQFVDCAGNLRRQLPPPQNYPDFTDFPSCTNSIFLVRSTNYEVESVINSFSNKNNAIDDFPFKILKLVSPFLSPLLSDIFNCVLQTGVYPDCLKSAKVTPLFKSGDRLNPANYRPISILSSVNKIFERLIFSRLNDFDLRNNILTKHQYGFMPY